jgi:hypothetical protein
MIYFVIVFNMDLSKIFKRRFIIIIIFFLVKNIFIIVKKSEGSVHVNIYK